MKKILLCLGLITVIACGAKEKTIESSALTFKGDDPRGYFEDKLFTGKVIEKYPNGNVFIEFQVKDGIPIYQKFFYENGKIQAEAQLLDFEPIIDTIKFYDENGNLIKDEDIIKEDTLHKVPIENIENDKTK